jgi:hypothetical protein
MPISTTSPPKTTKWCEIRVLPASKLRKLESKWFTRGWTLQELLAPAMLIFLDLAWEEIGTRDSLSATINQTTNIPEAVLRGTQSIDEITIATKMTWAAHRETTRIEDTAYCLLGIFNINMPIMYGERERAFLRLQEEILKITNDHSVFAWNRWHGFRPREPKAGNATHLAYFPEEFVLEGQIVTCPVVGLSEYSPESRNGNGAVFDKSIFVDNEGIHLRLPLLHHLRPGSLGPDDPEGFAYLLLLPYLMLLPGGAERRLAITLSRLETGVYTR